MAKRRIIRALVLVSLLAGLPFAASAFFFSRVSSGLPLALSRDQIVQGDYITAGETIDLQGNIDGDVIVAASRLVIAGSVSGDVIAVASHIQISGEVEGDVRVVAMNLQISGTIGRSLNAWGSTVSLAPAATVGRNAYIVAEQLEMSGAVERDLATRAVRQTFGGRVSGEARFELGDDGRAQLLPEASVGGKLTYVAARADQLDQTAVATSTIQLQHQSFVPPSSAAQQQWFLFRRVVSLFGLLVVGLVLVSLVPRYVLQLGNQIMRQPAWTLLWGLIIAAATPAVILVLAFTVIGLPLALLLAAGYVAGMYLAKVVAGLVFGIWLFQRASRGQYRGSLLLPMVAGMTAYVAVTSLFGPAGWAVKIVAVLLGLGAIAQLKAQELAKWR